MMPPPTTEYFTEEHIMINRFIRPQYVLLFFISSLISSNVLATSGPYEHWYFGFGIVTTDIQLNNDNLTSINNFSDQVTLENNTFGVQGFIGYQFDEHVALEWGFTDMGDININDGNTTQKFMSVSTSYLDAVLSQRINDSLTLFTQGGIAYWDTVYEGNDNQTNGTGLHFGAGMDINIFNNQDRMLRVKWEYLGADNILIGNTSSVSASILFTF